MDLISELEGARKDWLTLAAMTATHPAASSAYGECAKRAACLLSAAKQEPGLDKPFASFCPGCGPNVYIDEDGCCSSCGSTAIGDGLIRLNERIQALIRCPACDGTGLVDGDTPGGEATCYQCEGTGRSRPAPPPDGGLISRLADALDSEHASREMVLGRGHREPCETCALIVEAKEASALATSSAGERPEHPKLSIAIQEGYEPDAPPPAPAEKRWRCTNCGEVVVFTELCMHGGKYEHSGHQKAPGNRWLLWCGPVVAASDGGGG